MLSATATRQRYGVLFQQALTIYNEPYPALQEKRRGDIIQRGLINSLQSREQRCILCVDVINLLAIETLFHLFHQV